MARKCDHRHGTMVGVWSQRPVVAGAIALALSGALVSGSSARARQAHLRPAATLKATTSAAPTGPVVRLRWRDRARGETRWEVLRRPRRTVLRANSTRFTDRHVRAGRTYSYVVRPCRRSRCARAARVRIRVRTRTATPAPMALPPTGDAGPAPVTDPYAGSPTIGGCPVFPKDNAWNTDVTTLPVDRERSDAYIASFGSTTLWPGFGSGVHGDYGIPYRTVPIGQPLVPVRFHVDAAIAAESDPGPYPIPGDAPIEEAGDPAADHHVLVLRRGDCRLFELFDAVPQPDGWSVYSGATFDLRSNALRPDGHTSADAAGLPILPGLARVDEVQMGAILHALRVAVPRTQNAYIHPATHAASDSNDPALPPMGLRLRLKATYDISGLRGQSRVIARALQVYGALVADNTRGSRVYISGAPDPRWDDADLNQLKRIPVTALEAVVTGPIHPG
jgi:hypothetical protein